MYSHENTCVILYELKKFNLKVKHKIKKIISWLFFTAFSLVLSYLLIYLSK